MAMNVKNGIVTEEMVEAALTQTIPNQELMRTVTMGPFKHHVDDGLDLRKTAYEFMYTAISAHMPISKVFVTRAVEGVYDPSDDIKQLCFLIIAKIPPKELVESISRLVAGLKAIIQEKLKENAVKGVIEKKKEMTNAVMSLVEALKKSNIPQIEKQVSAVAN